MPTVGQIRLVAALMQVVGLMNLAVSSMVLSKTLRPEPTGILYWLLGPGLLLSGIAGIVVGRRNFQLQGRQAGMVALFLLGVTGLGCYQFPVGLVIMVAGLLLYRSKEARTLFDRPAATSAG